MKTLRGIEFLHELVLKSLTQNVILISVVILAGDDDCSFPSGHFPNRPKKEWRIMGDARDTAKKKKADEKKGAAKGAAAKPSKPVEASKPAAAKPAAKTGKK
jgi:hypothetical protein